jgi:maltose phosphorylase
VKNDTLNFSPKIPKQWKGYSFKVNFRNQIITVSITFRNYFSVDGTKDLTIVVNGESVTVSPNNQVAVHKINCKELVDYSFI